MHDIGLLADGRIVFVNTLYNCLATPSRAPQLHAHLEAAVHLQDRQGGPLPPERPGHGRRRAALRHGGEQVGHLDGWRDRRADGGIVIDVQTGEIVIGGLSMPHSPRLYAASSGC